MSKTIPRLTVQGGQVVPAKSNRHRPKNLWQFGDDVWTWVYKQDNPKNIEFWHQCGSEKNIKAEISERNLKEIEASHIRLQNALRKEYEKFKNNPQRFSKHLKEDYRNSYVYENRWKERPVTTDVTWNIETKASLFLTDFDNLSAKERRLLLSSKLKKKRNSNATMCSKCKKAFPPKENFLMVMKLDKWKK